MACQNKHNPTRSVGHGVCSNHGDIPDQVAVGPVPDPSWPAGQWLSGHLCTGNLHPPGNRSGCHVWSFFEHWYTVSCATVHEGPFLFVRSDRDHNVCRCGISGQLDSRRQTVVPALPYGAWISQTGLSIYPSSDYNGAIVVHNVMCQSRPSEAFCQNFAAFPITGRTENETLPSETTGIPRANT